MIAGYPSWVVFGLVLATTATLTGNALAQRPAGKYPSESELPDTRRPADGLRSEASLPEDNREADGEKLPGEDEIELLGQVDGAAATNDGQDPIAPIDGNSPILRLAFDGHTGTVRTLDISDGGRTLITAGEDKDVHVWRRTDVGNTGWMHRRTIRWPVQRGSRGRVYTATLKDDLVAFAGEGAFGMNGEIRIVDVASGDLLRTLSDEQEGHIANVLSLAWSPHKEQLASVDMEGRLILWQQEQVGWKPKTLVDVDARTYPPELLAAMKNDVEARTFVPVTFLGPHYVVVPRFVGPTADPNVVYWHLQRVNLRNGKSVLLKQMNHFTHVRDLDATEDGRVLASCDYSGTVGIWLFDASGATTSTKTFRPELPPLFVDLSANGKRLLVGTEYAEQQQAKLQIWDVQANPPRLLSERDMIDDVRAGVLDDEHGQAIVPQGNHVEVCAYDPRGIFLDQDPKRLTVPVKPIRKVAFAKSNESYRVAFGWSDDGKENAVYDGVFDLSESRLLGRAAIDAAEFIEPQRTADRWGTDPLGDRLFEGDQPRGDLPLRLDLHGLPTTVCTLPVPPLGTEEPNEKPATGAVIVGTGGRANIYVYKANASDPPELLRQFRNHSGLVTSLSTSADGNYLVSGSTDSTISVWNLQDVFTASKLVNRWGAEFEIEGDQLIATDVREDGPLFFRGVRGGDRLTLIKWLQHDLQSGSANEPVAMRQALLDLEFDLLPYFEFERLGRPGPRFQSYPAWRPLATLFVDQEREWAFWTPAGYYDASFNGHQRFGWQINNRNLDRPVEYFRAAQFRKQLERPDVMRRLLASGSLPAAMRRTVTQIGPPPADGAIVNQIESKPRIQLLSPDAGDTVEGDSLSVRAEIEVPLGATLVDPKAFVSGVPAIDRQIVPNREDAAAGVVTFEWDFRLPSDRQLQLEIIAATEAEAVDRVLFVLDHNPSDEPARKSRLHLLAIGASEYRDPQIQSLDFAAGAVATVSELFRTQSSEIYDTTADQLINNEATRPLWRVFAQSAAEQLSKSVSPNDLVVMYLCGHGLRDRRTNQWYFVTSDARYRDVMSDRYDDCIAFSDLAALAKLPCRKLAILDSCHSGAVQPLMRTEDLKSALRFLQDDVVLTITASEGDEEAAELRETQLGRFTAVLVDALKGEAPERDNDHKTVSLNEAIEYITRRVTEESERDGMPQHPTASPAYLLRTLELPLTSRQTTQPH